MAIRGHLWDHRTNMRQDTEGLRMMSHLLECVANRCSKKMRQGSCERLDRMTGRG